MMGYEWDTNGSEMIRRRWTMSGCGANYPLVMSNSYWKYHIYSWFTYSKWWFSIAMWLLRLNGGFSSRPCVWLTEANSIFCILLCQKIQAFFHCLVKIHQQKLPTNSQEGYSCGVKPYHLVICYSSPWKDPPFISSANHLFRLGPSKNHGDVSHNQRVSDGSSNGRPLPFGAHFSAKTALIPSELDWHLRWFFLWKKSPDIRIADSQDDIFT